MWSRKWFIPDVKDLSQLTKLKVTAAWGFHSRKNFRAECGCVHFTFNINPATRKQILQITDLESAQVFIPQTNMNTQSGFCQNLCFLPNWTRRDRQGQQMESWKLAFVLFLDFCSHLLCRGGTLSEVCWMLEYIMAEVSSPDEYQAYLMYRSDHHLPGAAPDSPNAAQTPPKSIREG